MKFENWMKLREGQYSGPIPKIDIDDEYYLQLDKINPNQEWEYSYRDKNGNNVGMLNVRPRSDYGVSIIDHGITPVGAGLGRRGLMAMAKVYKRIHSMQINNISVYARKSWDKLVADGIAHKRQTKDGAVYEIDL